MVTTSFAGGIWYGGTGHSLVVFQSVSDGLLVGVPVLVVGLGAVRARRFSIGWTRWGAWLASVVVVFPVIPAGLPSERYHQTHWYSKAPYPRIDRWPPHQARTHRCRSEFILNYSFHGPDLSSDVRFVGTKGPHGTYFDANTCTAWRHIMKAEGYDYVLGQNALLNGKALPSPTISFASRSERKGALQREHSLRDWL